MRFPAGIRGSGRSPRDRIVRTGWSISSYAIAGFLAGAIVILVAVYVLSAMAVADVEGFRKEQVVSAAQGQAARLSALFEHHIVTLRGVAGDPGLIAAIENGDAAALAERARVIAGLFANSLRVRLLPPHMDEPDTSSVPHLGYAALDLMREATAPGVRPVAWAHQPGTDQQHIAMVQRVPPDGESRPAGFIHLSLPVTLLATLVAETSPGNGYLEVQQPTGQRTSLKLAGAGNEALKDGAPSGVRNVPGTGWKVAYWQPPAAGVFAATNQPWFWSVVSSAILLFGLLLFLLFRRLQDGLRADQISIIQVAEALARGRVHRPGAVRIADNRGTVESMVDMARDAARAGAASTDAVAEITPPPLMETDQQQEKPALEISQQPQGTATVDPSIFRAYDIRGVVDDSLTPDAAYQIGRAIGSEAAERGLDEVVIGRDGRLSGPDLCDALSRGLQSAGRTVIDIGQVPTPVLYFATFHLGTQSGVVVTGSHNPPQYNGMKIVLGGETLSGDTIQALRRRIETGNLVDGQGSATTQDVVPDYVERIASDITIARPMKIAVDCGNGVAGAVVPGLLGSLGCEVIKLYCEVDGNFPNHHPDPSNPRNLEDLIATVRDQGADLGVAFDGDGDRLGVVDSTGAVIWPDRQMMLFARDILSRSPGADIIYDVKCSRHLGRVILESGGRPLMWKTGHSLIKAKIRETGALLAGEMSGHIFFKERWYGFDDALYSCARLLEVLSLDPRSSQEVFAELPDSVNTPELNISMQEGENFRFVDRLVEKAHFPDAKITTIDGLRADFEDSWGLVRASNTTPSLVLRFEADNEAALQRVQNQFREIMLELQPDLALPF